MSGLRDVKPLTCTAGGTLNLLSLDGKVAVVTGGAKGIGAATARVLEEAGARVMVFDIASEDDLAFGSVAVDVTNETALTTAFARVVERHGRLDILVNNAGRVARKPAVELDVADWQAVIDVNLKATFLCSRTAHPYMKQRGNGSIVNVASIMGLSGGLFPNASYQAAKGGVVNLTRALALEWAADGIRVNAVAPTYVDTDMTKAIFADPELMKTVMSHTPLRRLPEADEVAAAILYLCSDVARCVTGIVLPIDSGYLAR
jgi:NAD(P)-dependent dehydrogenase (short-subunit alcohol dehydrogenase family)